MTDETIIKYRKRDNDFEKLQQHYKEIWEVVEPDVGSEIPVVWYCCRGLKNKNEISTD